MGKHEITRSTLRHPSIILGAGSLPWLKTAQPPFESSTGELAVRGAGWRGAEHPPALRCAHPRRARSCRAKSRTERRTALAGSLRPCVATTIDPDIPRGVQWRKRRRQELHGKRPQEMRLAVDEIRQRLWAQRPGNKIGYTPLRVSDAARPAARITRASFGEAPARVARAGQEGIRIKWLRFFNSGLGKQERTGELSNHFPASLRRAAEDFKCDGYTFLIRSYQAATVAGKNRTSRSRRPFEDFPHLRRFGDRSRIARDPRRRHRLFGDAGEARGADLHCAEAARHAKAGDKGVEHLASIFTRMAHRRRHQRLSLGIDRLVPAHHRRQHDARGVTVRDVESGTQDIADAVACAHRHAAGDRTHRQPRTDLAIEARLEVGRIGLDARQAAREQRRSEEHTSELQSRRDLVCRLLLEKKKKK